MVIQCYVFCEEGPPDPRGNLHVKIQVTHSIFAVDGINLHCTSKANIFDFIIGGNVLIKTLDGGKVKVNIPAGTSPNTKFSIHGYGMPDLRTGRKGNLYVTIGGVVPKNLSQDEIVLLQKLRKRLDKKGVDS